MCLCPGSLGSSNHSRSGAPFLAPCCRSRWCKESTRPTRAPTISLNRLLQASRSKSERRCKTRLRGAPGPLQAGSETGRPGRGQEGCRPDRLPDGAPPASPRLWAPRAGAAPPELHAPPAPRPGAPERAGRRPGAPSPSIRPGPGGCRHPTHSPSAPGVPGPPRAGLSSSGSSSSDSGGSRWPGGRPPDPGPRPPMTPRTSRALDSAWTRPGR